MAALVAGLTLAPPAGAVPILDPTDAEELSAELAAAAEVQGICYGWLARVHDQGSGSSSADVGGSSGVGRLVRDDPSCPRWVELVVTLTYTSNMSESEDYGSFTVDSTEARAPSTEDLERIGISVGDLLGDRDDEELASAVLALPLLMAERGAAPPVPADVNTEPLPAGSRTTGTPGSDWLREVWPILLAATVMGLIAIAVAGGAIRWAVTGERQRPSLAGNVREPSPRRRPPTGTSNPPPSPPSGGEGHAT